MTIPEGFVGVVGIAVGNFRRSDSLTRPEAFVGDVGIAMSI